MTTRRNNGGTKMFGRDTEEWDELVTITTDVLEDLARSGQTTTYTGLNNVLTERTGRPSFDFARDVDRAAMGHLLGLVSERMHPEIGCMLTAIVLHGAGDGPGSGFFVEARKLELLGARCGKDEMLSFWALQVRKVFDAYA